MAKIKERVKKTVVTVVPDKANLVRPDHKKLDYSLLLLRNVFVSVAAVWFILSFFIDSVGHTLKAIGYFSGAGAYFFECLLLTDCFKKKVPKKEMFMVYCLGPLYILMGLNYIFNN